MNEETNEGINNKNHEHIESDDENEDGEEEKVQPQSKHADKNVSTKIFHNYESITDLKAFILKF